MFKKILLPVDQANYDEKTLNVVKDLALKYDSEVVIFNSQDISPNVYWVNDPIVMERIPTTTEDFSRDIVKKVAAFFEGSSLKITEFTSRGDPASEILHLLDKDQTIDLVVMATHGMKASKRFLLGSVTNKVVHHATVPVLVMR